MISFREYGASGPQVVLLHGGPGTPGYMAPLARALADSYRIVEPFQRASGGDPLTVDRHVEDMKALIDGHCRPRQPVLVGHSWGAMLALAYAAAHPDSSGPIVLVGCGTFDPAARARLEAVIAERSHPRVQAELDRLERTIVDPDARLCALGWALLPVYSYEADDGDLAMESCDARAHEETWADMLRLQAEGAYPAAFAAIRGPVLMLHGTDDPHPGAMIRDSLEPHLPQMQYLEWERCGHYPWLERAVRDEFFSVLRSWLIRHSESQPSGPDRA